MQLWISRPVGCSGLVVLAALDDRHLEHGFELGYLPSTWLVDVATAELAVEMLHDATTTGRYVDIDLIVDRAGRATGTRPA